VLTKENQGDLEQFVEEWKKEPINSGIIFEFYTYMHGQPEADKLWLNYEERDAVIDRILAIKAKYPNLVECTTNALELLRSENCRKVTDDCLASYFRRKPARPAEPPPILHQISNSKHVDN
jgi:hypothetical protein